MNFQHDIFISYRRIDGTPFAKRLRELLLIYRLPKALRQGNKRKKLSIYLDQVYEQATANFFNDTILPELKQSAQLVVIQTPAANQEHPNLPALPGTEGRNWVEREINAFRALAQGEQVSVALAIGDISDPLSADLHRQLPNIVRIRVDRLGPLWRFWPPARSRAIKDVLPLIAKLYNVSSEQMPKLHREEERRASTRRRLLTGLSATIGLLLSILTVWALSGQVSARRAEWRANSNWIKSRVSLADSLATRAQIARKSGELFSALHLVAKARRTALTPLAVAETLAIQDSRFVFSTSLAQEQAWSILFRPKSNQLLIGQLDGTVQLFHPPDTTGKVILRGKGIPVADLAFDSSSERLVVARSSPSGAAWNFQSTSTPNNDLHLLTLDQAGNLSAQTELTIPDPMAPVISVAISSASSRLVLATTSGIFLRSASGEYTPLPNPPERPATVSVTQDGHYASASSIYGDLLVWDLDAQTNVLTSRSIRPSDMFPYNDFRPAFHPHEARVATGSFDGSVRIWDFLNKDKTPTLLDVHDAAVTSVQWSPDGEHLFSGAFDGTVAYSQVTQAKTLSRILATPPGLPAATMNMAVSDDGSWLATSNGVPVGNSADNTPWLYGTIRLWEQIASPQVSTFETPVFDVFYDNEANPLLLRNRSYLALEKNTGKQIPLCVKGKPWTPISVARRLRKPVSFLSLNEREFSQSIADLLANQSLNRNQFIIGAIATDSRFRRLVTVGAHTVEGGLKLTDVIVVVCDQLNNTVFAELKVPISDPGALGPIAVSPDGTTAYIAVGKRLGSGSGGGQSSAVYSWQEGLSSMTLFDEWHGHDISSIALDDISQHLAISDTNGVVRIIDLQTRLNAEFEPALCCAPALLVALPQGRGFLRATLSEIGSLSLVNGQIQSHTEPQGILFSPTATAVSPDGSILLVGQKNGLIGLWQTNDLTKISEIRAQLGPVLAVRVAPDGNTMTSLSYDSMKSHGSRFPLNQKTLERVTRLLISNGEIQPLSQIQERDLLSALPSLPIAQNTDKIAAEFWRIMRTNRFSRQKPANWIQWLSTFEELQLDTPIKAWIQRNPTHPLKDILPTLSTLPD